MNSGEDCKMYMDDPIKHIECIKNEYMSSPKRTLDALSSSLKNIERNFPKYNSYLAEFIQNADDVGSRNIVIRLYEDRLEIYNDGREFSFEDVESICSIGNSYKNKEHHIGYMGVGFKSVFLISNAPEIHSGEYHFKFDKSEFPDENKVPWQIIPIWVNDKVDLGGYSTLFIIPFKIKGLSKKISEEIKNDISSRLLLFVNNIEKIEIQDEIKKTSLIFSKENLEKKDEFSIYRLKEPISEDNKEDHTNWVVFGMEYEIPEHVKNDYNTKLWDRSDIKKREIRVAFKLDDDFNLVPEESGTAHMGVFSFLPLKEVESGLNFLVHGDFLTNEGRSDINRDAEWNKYIIKKIEELIKNVVIPNFKTNEKWIKKCTKVLCSNAQGHILFNELRDKINEYVKTERCMVVYTQHDGKISYEFANPEDVVGISYSEKLNRWEEIFEVKDLVDYVSTLDEIKKLLLFDIEIGDCINMEVISMGFNAQQIYDGLLNYMKFEANRKNIDFFKRIYKAMYNILDGYKTKNGIPNKYKNKRHEFVLTSEWELVKHSEVYIDCDNIISKYNQSELVNVIKSNIKVIHTGLCGDSDIISLFKDLFEIENLTEEEIENIVRTKKNEDWLKQITKEVKQITKEDWENFEENKKIETTRKIFNLMCENKLNLDLDIVKNYITLKANDGKWHKPEYLVLPKRYNPDHNLEEIYKAGLYDGDLQFLSEEYLSLSEEVKKISNFMKKLGVDSLTQERSVSERIGILTTLKYEKENKRDAHEIGHSEEKTKKHYDVESKDHSGTEKRCIEVKSSKNDAPITFHKKEFDFLFGDDGNSNCVKYIYVVFEPLKNPTLYIFPISHVKEGINIKDISISFKDLKKSKNVDVWYPLHYKR